MPSPVRKYISRRAATASKYQQPSWWALFTYGGLAVLVLYTLFSSLGGDTAVSPEASAARSALRGTLKPAQIAAPGASAPTTTTGGATTPAPSPATGSLPAVGLPGPGGRVVQVPGPAALVAANSMRALFDPAAAALVPLVGGGVLPAPASDPAGGAKGWVRNLTVVSYVSPRLKVTALVDPDGDGPLGATTVYRTLLLQGTTWAVSPTE